MAIHLFASAMCAGRPVRMFGDGSSSRDYTYIDDIVDGVVASIERCAGFEILNLGGRSATSLAELVALIGRALGVTPRVERMPDQPGDVPLTFADVDKAARVLGYRPKVGIEEGIGLFCDWLKVRPR